MRDAMCRSLKQLPKAVNAVKRVKNIVKPAESGVNGGFLVTDGNYKFLNVDGAAVRAMQSAYGELFDNTKL